VEPELLEEAEEVEVEEVEEVEAYQPHQEAEVVEAEEVLQEDHHLPMDNSKAIPLSNSQVIEKGAKHLCLPFKSIKE